MKHILIRFQILFVSVILLLTLGMTWSIVLRYNKRWDFTREKIYSFAPETKKLFQKLEAGKIKITAFYPHEDPARKDFELFLKEARLYHSDLEYAFYDPDRVPSLASRYGVKDFYTVIIEYNKKTERVYAPNEETFSNALMRLAYPKQFQLCFSVGHGESGLQSEERNGLKTFARTMEDNNYVLVNDVILSRDGVPANCSVVVVPGPHQDFVAQEFDVLHKAFAEGKGILFLIDPMDPGAGKLFGDFMKSFGVLLGTDVIVDKMSRLVGGDFLVPMVSQYVEGHPLTQRLTQPTFFPVSRSVQPTTEAANGFEAVPLALTGSGSWAETDLVELEKGQATFQSESDLPGPIPIAVAVEKFGLPKDKPESGRLVAVGDSDFITNAYLGLSGNLEFALAAIQWLSKDERFIALHRQKVEFKPLFLKTDQRLILLSLTLGVLPLAALFILGAFVVSRKKKA